jgi:hypothetical protein
MYLFSETSDLSAIKKNQMANVPFARAEKKIDVTTEGPRKGVISRSKCMVFDKWSIAMTKDADITMIKRREYIFSGLKIHRERMMKQKARIIESWPNINMVKKLSRGRWYINLTL